MPTYAYACTTCEHRFEVQQSFSDQALTECPECAGRLRKLFNTVGIVFKGSGFYRTDSRSTDGAGGTSKGSTGSGSDGGTSPSSAEKTKSSTASDAGGARTGAAKGGATSTGERGGSGSRAATSVGGSAA